MNAAKHAHHLCVEIGPRPPASAAEAEAAQYCVSVFESAGMQPRIEPFRGLRSFGRTYLPLTAGALAGAVMAMRKKPHRLTGSAIGAAAIGTIYREATSRSKAFTERIASDASQNVVAVAVPAGEVRARLVLVAHMDSSRSGWAFAPARAGTFRQATMLATAAAATSVAAWALPRRLRRLVATASALVLGASLTAMIEREVNGTDVEGANDNASGVGVLLALAEEIARQPLTNTEIWFLVTGCEESDTVGMHAFLDRHARDLEDASFVGIDSVGGRETTLRWITQSGLLSRVPADLHLVRIAESVASHLPEIGAEQGVWRTAPIDTDAAAARGGRVMTFMSLTHEGTIPSWHWPSDTYENLDESMLDATTRFVTAFVREFDGRA